MFFRSFEIQIIAQTLIVDQLFGGMIISKSDWVTHNQQPKKFLPLSHSDPFIWSGDLDEDTCRPDEPVVNHIDLERVLINLPNIEQVNLQFGMIYGDSGFEWRDFEWVYINNNQ